EMIEAELAEVYVGNMPTSSHQELYIPNKNNKAIAPTKSKSINILNEANLNLCIQNYHRIVDILVEYRESSARRIIFEIIYNSLLILSYLFTAFNWIANGAV